MDIPLEAGKFLNNGSILNRLLKLRLSPFGVREVSKPVSVLIKVSLNCLNPFGVREVSKQYA